MKHNTGVCLSEVEDREYFNFCELDGLPAFQRAQQNTLTGFLLLHQKLPYSLGINPFCDRLKHKYCS